MKPMGKEEQRQKNHEILHTDLLTRESSVLCMANILLKYLYFLFFSLYS